MQIVQDSSAGLEVVALEGRVDSANAAEVESALIPLVERGNGIVIDLEQLAYISSAGLRILLVAAKRSKADGSRLALAGLQPQVREVFDISGFSKLFEIHESRAAAVAALS